MKERSTASLSPKIRRFDDATNDSVTRQRCRSTRVTISSSTFAMSGPGQAGKIIPGAARSLPAFHKLVPGAGEKNKVKESESGRRAMSKSGEDKAPLVAFFIRIHRGSTWRRNPSGFEEDRQGGLPPRQQEARRFSPREYETPSGPTPLYTHPSLPIACFVAALAFQPVLCLHPFPSYFLLLELLCRRQSYT